MRFLFIFIIFCLLTAGLDAQNKISISGEIKDESGLGIPVVSVALEGTTFGTYSNDNGYYSLEVPHGTYTIHVSAIGFKTKIKTLEVKNNTIQDFILEEETINLSQVEVYGKGKSQQLREGNLSVNAIDIKSIAGSIANLNSIIGRSSGIRIREEGGMGADFDLTINGLSGNSIRYFIDGVPLSTIGNSVNLANLPVNIVERTEIYKGVVPTELGADALGGAINIITKKDVKNYLDASYSIGSFNSHQAEFNAQYQNPKTNFFIRPGLGVNYSKNNYMMKGVEVWDAEVEQYKKINTRRFHDDYFSLVGQIAMGITNKKWADLLSVTVSLSNINKEIQTGNRQSVVYGEAKNKNNSYGILAQYRKKDFLTKNLTTDMFASHTRDYSVVTDTAYRQYRWDGSYREVESSSNEITGRGKSIRHINRPLTVVRSNFNYTLNAHHSFNLNYLLNHVKNNRYDDIDTDFEPSEDILSKHIIGMSYNQRFMEGRLDNTLFGKSYINHLEIGQQDLSWITGSSQMPKSSTSESWGYGLASRFRFFDSFSVKASYENSVRLPLAREYLGNGTTVYPNFKLEPETSNNINLGVFGSIDLAPKHRLYYEATGFIRKVENYIRLVVTEADNLSQYDNVNNVSVKGIEGELRYDYNNSIQLVANASYLEEKSKTKYQANGKPNITYNNRMPNRPWLYSNAELNFRKQDIFGQKDNQLKLAYIFQYVHWFYLTWAGYGTLKTKAVIPTQYLNSAQLTYSIKNEKYSVSVECNNIFDRLTYDNYMLQKPGRSFFCKFRLFIN